MIFNLIWLFFGLLMVWISWHTIRQTYYIETSKKFEKNMLYVFSFLLFALILTVLGGYSLLMMLIAIWISGEKPVLWSKEF